MPRLIDHVQRDADIAAASFRVLERDGLTGLSVRRVADEAGIATASLRRAFPTQHDLRERCLELVEERTRARIMAITATGRERVEHMLAQLLPLDRDRRLELTAQVQLGMLALTDTRLRDSAVRLSDGVGYVCRTAIALLAEAAKLDGGRDPEFEAQRLRALVDGLAMRALWTAEPLDAKGMLAVLARHLDELGTPPGAPEPGRMGRMPSR